MTTAPEAEVGRLLALEQTSPTMFEILGVAPETATLKSIKKAYNALVLLTHPDKVSVAHAADAFALVTRAYKALASDALLDRARAAAIKRGGAGGAGGGAAAGAAAGSAEAEALARAKEQLRETYLADVRKQEEADRRRSREEAEVVAKEKQRMDILRHTDEWRAFRVAPAAASVAPSASAARL